MAHAEGPTKSSLPPLPMLHGNLLEIPTFTRTSAQRALSLALHTHTSQTPRSVIRIELNAPGSYPQGGLTPSIQDLQLLQRDVSAICSTNTSSSGDNLPPAVGIRVMIRPRGPPPKNEHDFIYTDSEFEEMREQIRAVRPWLLDAEPNQGVADTRGNGFVFGILKKKDGQGSGPGELEVDVERCAQLASEIPPNLDRVFHRAFDEVVDHGGNINGEEGWRKAIRDIQSCGFGGILTSGGSGTAAGDGNVKVLKGILELGKPLGMEIIVGGGVRLGNLKVLRESLVVSDVDGKQHMGGRPVVFHSSCLSPSAGDGTPELNDDEVRGMVDLLQGMAG